MKKELMALAGQGLAHAEKASLTMTTREIAELINKQHGHVMRDVEQMLAQLGESPEGYTQNWIHPQNNQEYRMYVLDRDHTECLITGYSAVLRMKIIKRLRELEESARPSLSLPEALRLAADIAEQKLALEHKIAEDAHKVEFVDQYVNSFGSMGFREVCKLLKVKETVLRRFILDHGVMYSLAGKLVPYANQIEAGRITVKTGESMSNGHAFTQAKFTSKGVQWLTRKLVDAGVLEGKKDA